MNLSELDKITQYMVGMTEEECINYCKKNKYDFRIVSRDSIPYIITCDFRVDRFNLSINEGIISEITIG